MIDLARIPTLVEQFHSLNEALESATKKYKELSVSIDTLKFHGIDTSSISPVIEQALHSSYIELSKLDKFTKDIEPDPLVVETAKLLYPNIYDNQQLRADPPIAGVCKLERLYASSNLPETTALS